MRVLHLMSCRGWSSDAYWAAGITAALARNGHRATLVCRRGSDTRVIDRARETGVDRIATLGFRSGVRPASAAADVRALAGWLADTDVVHVHRGKEHWLAAAANRIGGTPRPIVRTRHISQAVRPHALNRWLYGRATSLVVTVTEAIRRQYLAAGLLPADRVVALPGGVDLARFHPEVEGSAFRRALGLEAVVPLVGVVSNLRAMKGHEVVIEATRRLAATNPGVRIAFIGAGPRDGEIQRAVEAAGQAGRITFAGFVSDLPGAIASLDVAVYAPLESEGMSRVIFEYLAMGKAIVASRVGVVPEVLEDDRTALLVPAGDASALAAALGRVLDDVALRVRLGCDAARLAASTLSSTGVARALAELYARVTSLEHRPPG